MSALDVTAEPVVAPSFTREAGVAAALTLTAGLLWQSGWLLSTLAGYTASPNTNYWLAVLACAYQLHLCLRSGARVGPVTLLLVWTICTLAALLLEVPVLLFVAGQTLLLSCTRSLLFHPRPAAFLLDVGISLTAALGAIWILLETRSTLLCIWTFFLIQAGWTWIGTRDAVPDDSTHRPLQAFERAHTTATAAIRRLTRRNRA